MDSKFFTDEIDALTKQSIDAINLAVTNSCSEAFSVQANKHNDLKQANEQKIAQEILRVKTKNGANAKLEASNIVLKAKQDAINTAYSNAKKQIFAMTDVAYARFIENLIIKNAKSGDTIVLGTKDTNKLGKDFITNLTKKHNLVLKVSDKTHNSTGGVLLQNDQYDKNLTIDNLINSIKDETEPKVLTALFG